METTALTTSIDAETAAIVHRLAVARGQSIGEVAAVPLQDAALSGRRLLGEAQVGLEDLRAGRTIPHDIVMQELDAMVTRHRARCRD